MSTGTHENQLVIAAFARVRPVALGGALGILCGLGLLLATGTLLILASGKPAGHAVGTHLGLLRHFLPGYEVSWMGAGIGLVYGLLIGFVLGLCLGWLLNGSHNAYIRHIERGMRRRVMQDGL